MMDLSKPMEQDGILGATTPNHATVNGIGVWYAPNTLHACNAMCAGAITMQTILGYHIDIIMVDDDFMKLSKKSRYFFINHEIGHIRHGDLVTLQSPAKAALYNLACMYGVSKMELLADLHACKRTGISTALAAFRELSKTSNKMAVKLQMFKRALVLYTYYRLHKEALE